MPTYSINASEIAAIAGRNPYETQQNAVEKFRSRCDRKRFEAEIEERSEQPEWLQAKKLCTDERFKEIVNTAEKKTTRTTNELSAKKFEMDNNMRSLGAIATEKEKNLVRNEVLGKANKLFGTELEEKVRERWSKETGKSVRRDDSIHSKQLFKIGEHIFSLRGKIDGVVEENQQSVLEIKSRTKRLFHTVKDYEMIQVQAYCFLLDYDKAYLVEALKTEDDFEMDWVDIQKDDDLWSSVVDDVIQAVSPHFLST